MRDVKREPGTHHLQFGRILPRIFVPRDLPSKGFQKLRKYWEIVYGCEGGVEMQRQVASQLADQLAELRWRVHVDVRGHTTKKVREPRAVLPSRLSPVHREREDHALAGSGSHD